jgi:hypothetical protein
MSMWSCEAEHPPTHAHLIWLRLRLGHGRQIACVAREGEGALSEQPHHQTGSVLLMWLFLSKMHLALYLATLPPQLRVLGGPPLYPPSTPHSPATANSPTYRPGGVTHPPAAETPPAAAAAPGPAPPAELSGQRRPPPRRASEQTPPSPPPLTETQATYMWCGYLIVQSVV